MDSDRTLQEWWGKWSEGIFFYPWERTFTKLATPFEEFIHKQTTSGIVLLVGAGVALIIANSPLREGYEHLIHTTISLKIGPWVMERSLAHWINEGLMTLFFFVVGLEIKREILAGELADFRRASLPIVAAIGGMVTPALIYYLINPSGEAARGWGIPMATDIAFALGVLSLFGKRVPIGLKVFLTALAIADDLGAVLIIAIFYTKNLDLAVLVLAGIFMLAILGARNIGIRSPVVYLLLAIVVWVDVFESGVHATVAGVLLAMLMPVKAGREPEQFFAEVRERWEALRASDLTRDSMIHDRSQLDAISNLRRAAQEMEPAGLLLEERLHPFVVFFILPLFAFFNAGVRIDGSFTETLAQPVSLGVILGLVFGKQVGITLFSWIAVKSGKAALPEGVDWGDLYGAACLGGVGFTMSLFIAELAFETPVLGAEAKIGILTASLIAALWGIVVLATQLARRSARADHPAVPAAGRPQD
jgi:NhaA family Na+:H+ antiporter